MKTSSRSLGHDSRKESSPAGKRDRNGKTIFLMGKAFSAILAFAVPIMIGCGGSHASPSSISSATQTAGVLTLSAVTPDSADVASPVTVQVTGAGFDSSSVIMLNGNTVPTTLVNSTTVTSSLAADAATAPTAVDVVVSNSASNLVSNSLKFYWVRPLRITSTTLASATQGSSYQVTLTATGGRPQYNWTAKSGLPAGLTISSSGAISGTPSGSGNFSVNLVVSDSSYPVRNASATLALQVSSATQAIPPPLAISSSTLPAGTVTKSYSGAFSATGGTTPYTWSVSSGSLPAGLSLAPATGVISGTPTVSGTSNFSVSVSDSSPTVQKQSSATSVTVAAAPVAQLAISSSTLPAGTVTKSYGGTVSATGGTSPYTWSVSSGSLPAGLSLTSATGVISGTPTASGSSSFTVSVSDSSPTVQKQSSATSITVAAAAPVAQLAINSSTLPNGTVTKSYSGTVSATGGTSPYTWSVSSGSLPTGLSLTSATGVISGTPTASGSSSFTVSVSDSSSTVQKQSSATTITVAAAPSPLTITSLSLPSATVGTGYSATLAATGGTPAYTWTISSGSLPAGLTLAATTGAISGMPTSSGTFNFSVSVADNGVPVKQQSATTSIAVTSIQSNSTLSSFPVCSGTQSSYSCTKSGASFPTIQFSPADLEPAVLQTYADPSFGSSVQRITPPSGHEGTEVMWAPIYSTKTPFSRAKSYILEYLASGNYFLMSGQTYAPIHELYFANACTGTGPWPGNSGDNLCANGNGDSSAIHWMLTNDDCFYYFSSAKLVQYCVSRDTTTLIRDFAATGVGTIGGGSISYVYTRDYNDFSDDDNKVALEIHGTQAGNPTIGFLTYQISTNTILAVRTQCVSPTTCDFQYPSTYALNSNSGHAAISPSGNYVQMGWVCTKGSTCPIQNGREYYEPVVLDSATMRYQHSQACVNSGHADLGWDAQGNEVWTTICTDYGSSSYRAITTFRLSDGWMTEYPVDSSFYNGANGNGGDCGPGCSTVYHLSMQGTRGSVKGYALLSTFTSATTLSPNPDIGIGTSTDGFASAEIFAVKLDAATNSGTCTGTGTTICTGTGTTYRIVHDQAIRSDYWAETHGTVDYDFSTVVWASSWRNNCGVFPWSTKDCVNTYVVNIK